MARHKELYKGRRRLHGEGTGRFCTVNLREEIANEFKLVVKAYSEVYGERVTPTQVIKRLMDAGLKRCDPEVFDAFIRLTEVGPEPVLEIVHHVDPTEGNVWEMKYFFEKDGEQIPAEWAKSDKASFSAKINNRYCGVREMNKNGWTLRNDAGIDITEEQAMVIAQKRRKHLEDIEEQRWREQARRYNEQLEEEEVPAFDYKYKLEKDGEVKEVSHYELQDHLEDGWKPHTEISMRDFED